MTTETSKQYINSNRHRTKLWYYGLVVTEIGIVFWILAFNTSITMGLLDVFYVNKLSPAVSSIPVFQFLLALTGAVMAGWGITFMAASENISLKTRQYLVTGLTVWFILDGVASVVFGFWINAVLNLMYYIPGIVLLRNSAHK